MIGQHQDDFKGYVGEQWSEYDFRLCGMAIEKPVIFSSNRVNHCASVAVVNETNQRPEVLCIEHEIRENTVILKAL